MIYLQWPSTSMQRVDENNYRYFVKKLLYFFKPNNKLFSEVEIDNEMAKTEAKSLILFCDFLLNIPEVRICN